MTNAKNPFVSKTNFPWNRFPLKQKQKDALFAWFLLAPALIILGLFVFFPILQGIHFSFLEYTLETYQNPTWNNFANYIELFESGEIFVYLRNTLVYVSGVVSVEFFIAFGLAMLLNADIKGRNLLRGLFLISWVTPVVVGALLWVWMLQPQYGVVNFLLADLLHLIEPNQTWTQHPQLAMASVILATIWRQAPFMIVMFLAGLQSIPTSLLEAAKIDGANERNIVWHVIMPLMRPVIGTTVMITIINNFQMFVIIYTMTQGGPVDRTTTLSVGAFIEAFTRFNTGKGTAIGVIWLVILVLIALVFNKLIINRDEASSL